LPGLRCGTRLALLFFLNRTATSGARSAMRLRGRPRAIPKGTDKNQYYRNLLGSRFPGPDPNPAQSRPCLNFPKIVRVWLRSSVTKRRIGTYSGSIDSSRRARRAQRAAPGVCAARPWPVTKRTNFRCQTEALRGTMTDTPPTSAFACLVLL
jgi:hypothetical protein